ncbi:MAG: hypothetical protein O7D35_05390, partial [Acidobacteria bacterium]|nr:hypothetical protein [Acidobacteriota bacterium]
YWGRHLAAGPPARLSAVSPGALAVKSDSRRTEPSHKNRLRRLPPAVSVYGAGFRYLLSRKLGLTGGLDLARGADENTLLIIFGSAW